MTMGEAKFNWEAVDELRRKSLEGVHKISK